MRSPQWADLSGHDKDSFVDRARQKTERREPFTANDVTAATMERWRAFWLAPIEERGDPNRWNVISEFSGKVPVEWERQLIAEQSNIQDAKAKPQPEKALDEVTSRSRWFDTEAWRALKATSKGDKTQVQNHADLLRRFNEERRLKFDALGGKRQLTREEEQAILDPLLVGTAVEHWFKVDTQGPPYRFQQSRQAPEAPSVVIPAADREQIIGDLQRAGRKVNEANIRAMYDMAHP
jgi:hypothetical protein